MSLKSVFLCDNIRTPVGRYGGGLSSVRADDLAALPIRELLKRNPNLDPAAIEEVCLGAANQSGEDNRNVARMAALLAGLPKEVPGVTVNRLCASGLEAAGQMARAVQAGAMDLAIAGGAESMSRAPMVVAKATSAFSRNAEMYDSTIGWRFVNPELHRLYGSDGMPVTGENVAEDYNISREDQDSFALRSQQKAESGKAARAEEIMPVTIPQRKGEPLIIDTDEHPRSGTTLGALARLRTPFKDNGTVTAGNASGVNDGAAAMLIASETALKGHQLEPTARILSMASAGVAPRVMGVGPVFAIQKVLKQTGLSLSDMDVIELNEAFAAQSVAVLRELQLEDDDPRVNPNGGAIALGHPLGMSGARLLMTAAREMNRRNGRYALISLCVGVGQGLAMIIEAA